MGKLQKYVVTTLIVLVFFGLAFGIGVAISPKADLGPIDPVVAKARDNFTQLFLRAKEQAWPGCAAVAGKLRVSVDQKSGAVVVACEIGD